MRKILFLFMGLLAAQAMARVFPPNARFGTVNAVETAQIKIEKQVYRSAPGLRIFNLNGATVFLRQLPVETRVGYQIDLHGELIQIWMLTPEEIKQKSLD